MNINELVSRFPASSLHRIARLPHPGAPPPATVEGWVTPDTKPVDGWFRDPLWDADKPQYRLNFFKDGVDVGCVRLEESGTSWCGSQFREEWLVHRSPLSGVSLEEAMKHVEAYEVKPFVDMNQAWLDATTQLHKYPAKYLYAGHRYKGPFGSQWSCVFEGTATGVRARRLERGVGNKFAGRIWFSTFPSAGWYVDMQGMSDGEHFCPTGPHNPEFDALPHFTDLEEAIREAEGVYAAMSEEEKVALHNTTILERAVSEGARRGLEAADAQGTPSFAATVVPSEDPYAVDFDPTYFQVDSGSLAGMRHLPPIPPHPSADSFPASAQARQEALRKAGIPPMIADDYADELERLLAQTGVEIDAALAQDPNVEAPPGDLRNAPSTASSPFSAPKHDHPAHYGGKNNPYEAIRVIEAWSLDFCLGNLVKYVSRAGKKAGETKLDDLRKARWYLDRAISNLETPNPKETP